MNLNESLNEAYNVTDPGPRSMHCSMTAQSSWRPWVTSSGLLLASQRLKTRRLGLFVGTNHGGNVNASCLEDS